MPSVVVSVWPSLGVPETTGSVSATGADAGDVTTADGSERADCDPATLLAVTCARTVALTSSGTSAVAVAAATHGDGDGDVVVAFPGGPLAVRLQDGVAYLSGPAERV